MHRRAFGLWIFAGLGLLVPLAGQEGHPMTGTWHGDWASSASQRTRLVLYMKWDSKNVTGMINPGPRSIPLTAATLDASKWTVHLEGEGKDQGGNPVKIVADGKMDNIGSYNRTITGTWSQGSAKGDFKLTRD
jgi:hypothetical protein